MDSQDDPLLVAMRDRSPRCLLLLMERLERLTAVRSAMVITLDVVRTTPSLLRAARRSLDAMDVHLAALQQGLRDVQAERWDPQVVSRLADTWNTLLEAQRLVR